MRTGESNGIFSVENDQGSGRKALHTGPNGGSGAGKPRLPEMPTFAYNFLSPILKNE